MDHKYAGLTVDQILRQKKAGITRAPLPKGTPDWLSVRSMTWEALDAAASADRIGFRTIRKLLTDGRFDR